MIIDAAINRCTHFSYLGAQPFPFSFGFPKSSANRHVSMFRFQQVINNRINYLLHDLNFFFSNANLLLPVFFSELL